MYHIISNSKRKCRRCDNCGAYYPCTTYEGYCMEVEGLVDKNGTSRRLLPKELCECIWML